MEKTLGGDRIGSGNKITQELHNYGMNSFNQGRDFKSTMAPGILYPCFKEIGTNFGTFDIDIDAFVRTLPTKGPLFGSFKMQVDLYNAPFRLYQGMLHNNPIDIGMNMHRVYLPAIEISTIDGANAPRVEGANDDDCQIATSALEKYLGLSGIGHVTGQDWDEGAMATRQLQCVPELAYYDIFKNYYSNKQEQNAYVITPGTPREIEVITRVIQGEYGEDNVIADYNPYNGEELTLDINNNWSFYLNILVKLPKQYNTIDDYISDENLRLKKNEYEIIIDNDYFVINTELLPNGEYQITAITKTNKKQTIIDTLTGEEGRQTVNVTINNVATSGYTTADIALTPFELENIDAMRSKLLSVNNIGQKFIIKNAAETATTWGTDSGEDNTGLPYSALVKTTADGITWNAFTQNGLVVKTYQSDLFNNWLDNAIVESIARRTKIDTSEGGFTVDTLILQEKIYKLLNRILVAGGTYYDWQEATYGEGVARMCEIPMYIGGMSTEIMFEEVINNSASEVDGRYQALGSLGGKGVNTGRKGGNNIHVRMDEPGYIIGIVSITPRISVSQGNDWDRTELLTMDDLHKPELDGIGFQDLMVEQLAWWNTQLQNGEVINRDAVGKQTAWINYQTALDKVYGDFAKPDGYSFMVLSRNYEHGDNPEDVKDITTYIDPAKFNYAFAYQDLAAQNFWVQLQFKCMSRRKMGAQQLPML